MLGHGSLTFSSLEAILWAFRVRECVRCLERHRKVGGARGMSGCGGCNPPVEYRVSACARVSCRYLQHDLKVAWRRMCLPIHLDFSSHTTEQVCSTLCSTYLEFLNRTFLGRYRQRALSVLVYGAYRGFSDRSWFRRRGYMSRHFLWGVYDHEQSTISVTTTPKWATAKCAVIRHPQAHVLVLALQNNTSVSGGRQFLSQQDLRCPRAT